MDYQFLHTIDGVPSAQFSMGHEVIGYWLNEEIKGDLALISQIETATKVAWSNWQLIGHEYSLFITDQEVIIRANQLDFICQEALLDDLNYYDDESTACCGLTDLLIMLEHYRAFILSSVGI